MDVAWQAFVHEYSSLLLQVARSTTSGHDSAMDAYSFLLEELRGDDCRRLRSYAPHEATRFSTWLLVVGRRLCIDFHRRRYGRAQGSGAGADQSALERATRRRLVDLAAEEIDIDSLTDDGSAAPDSEIRLAQIRTALANALDALSAGDRLLLVMRFDDGRSASEIARALGFPTPFHVYRKLSAVLGRLRILLTGKGVHDSRP